MCTNNMKEMKNDNYVALDAEMFNFEYWFSETDPKILQQQVGKILLDCEFKVVQFSDHYFPINGYTAVWLLAESHLAIHTFPNKNKTYLQISSCNNYKLKKLKSKIKTLFKNY